MIEVDASEAHTLVENMSQNGMSHVAAVTSYTASHVNPAKSNMWAKLETLFIRDLGHIMDR